MASFYKGGKGGPFVKEHKQSQGSADRIGTKFLLSSLVSVERFCLGAHGKVSNLGLSPPIAFAYEMRISKFKCKQPSFRR